MKINKELQKGSNITIILKLLENKSMYGYELIKVIELKSNTLFKFKEGTLYPILHSLEQDGQLNHIGMILMEEEESIIRYVKKGS